MTGAKGHGAQGRYSAHPAAGPRATNPPTSPRSARIPPRVLPRQVVRRPVGRLPQARARGDKSTVPPERVTGGRPEVRGVLNCEGPLGTAILSSAKPRWAWLSARHRAAERPGAAPAEAGGCGGRPEAPGPGRQVSEPPAPPPPPAGRGSSPAGPAGHPPGLGGRGRSGSGRRVT